MVRDFEGFPPSRESIALNRQKEANLVIKMYAQFRYRLGGEELVRDFEGFPAGKQAGQCDFSQWGRNRRQKSMVFHNREGLPCRKLWFFTKGRGLQAGRKIFVINVK